MIASRSLSRLVGLHRRWLIVSVGLAAVQAALLIPIGLLLRTAFDQAIPDADTAALLRIGAALLALSLASGALALWTRWLVLTVTKRAIAQLRVTLLARLQWLPATWFHRRDGSELHAIVVEDSERVDVMANALAAQVLPATIITGALAVALAILDPLLFAILAVTLLPMLLASYPLRPRVGERTRAWQHAFDRFSARIRFAIRARSLVAAQAAERIELDVGAKEMRSLSESGRSMAWLHSLYAQVNGTLATISAVVVLVVGGLAVGRGATTLGSLISFYALLGLMRGQLGQLLFGIPQLITGRESLLRLEAILDAEDTPAYSGTGRIDFRGEIGLRGVEFGYGDRPVLHDVDLTVEPGEWVAIVGPNGAGKSTIAALILGIYRPASGIVCADGVPIGELDLGELRRRIALVPQDPIVFNGTVAENIAYGEPLADPATIREAASLAGVEPALTALRYGFDTRVGDEGEQLSGGQRQAIAIARALIRRPALLILDEPSTSLDRGTVPAMLSALQQLPWRPSVLLISHDEAVLGVADRAYRLEDGRARLERPASSLLRSAGG